MTAQKCGDLVDVDKVYHAGELDWKEGEFDVHRGFHWSAPGCHSNCGMLFYLKDGKLDHVEGDPLHPTNQGKLCPRCLAMTEIAYSDDRLKYPMKRSRQDRGKDNWERLSWDEALDLIESEVNRIRETYGPQSIMAMEGTGRSMNWNVPYLTYCGFKSPNFVTAFLAGDSCAIPRISMCMLMYGGWFWPDFGQTTTARYDRPDYVYPDLCLFWGANTILSSSAGDQGSWFLDGMREANMQLIVIDPQVTWAAAHSALYIQPRPGTDAAIAMAIGNVIIEEDLYDHEFVDCWVAYLDEYAEAVSVWTPERAAEVAWCDAEDIYRAARMIASAERLILETGVSVDMSTNGTMTAQAIFSLLALTGNVEKPGTNIFQFEPFGLQLMYSAGWDEGVLSDDMKKMRLDGGNALREGGFAGSASAEQMLITLETEDPYPLRMCWIAGANPVTCMGADAPRVYRAMDRSLEFTVVLDYVMTPTAMATADLVLPIAMSWERNTPGVHIPAQVNKKVASYCEAWSDEKITVEVGKRVNPEFFAAFDTDMDLIQRQYDIAGAPMTAREVQDRHYVFPDEQVYNRHEKGLLRSDGTVGFNTPTGRIELRITTLDMFGLPSLPYYEEPVESPISTPELFKEYPFVLTTGGRDWCFFHSENRNIPTLRSHHPDPIVKMNPDDADGLGLESDDWVWIENQRGRCRERVRVTPGLKEGIIIADHAWWFPEMKENAGAPSFYGNFDSNINNLTQQGAVGPLGFGSPYRGLLCKVYRCTEENSAVLPGEIIVAEGGQR